MRWECPNSSLWRVATLESLALGKLGFLRRLEGVLINRVKALYLLSEDGFPAVLFWRERFEDSIFESQCFVDP